MAINGKGHLEIGGCDTVELTKRYGTPLYVFDEEEIRRQCRRYLTGLSAGYGRAEVIYAGKAFLVKAMCRIVEQEGLSLDVVSGGELYTALMAGFPPERIYFHGNNKSVDEIKLALASGVGRFMVDNLYELALLDRLAAEFGRTACCLLRVSPGIEAHTHSYMKTGQVDSKFGIGLSGGQALTAIKQALSCRNIRLTGVHCHIGSQIFDLEPFKAAIQVIMEFLAEVRRELGITLEELDLGGGLGIRYSEGDKSPSPEEYGAVIGNTVRTEALRLGLPLPKLLCEPGRSIVAQAGTTLYTIGAVKEIPGIRTYIAIDGGMGDNPRVALYQARYEAVVANKANQPLSQLVTVAGKYCESGDILIWDLPAPVVEPGDVLAVFSTGAYNYSMASNYNRVPRPAVVGVWRGESTLWVRRESYADLVRLDVMPSRLAHGLEEVAAGHSESVSD